MKLHPFIFLLFLFLGFNCSDKNKQSQQFVPIDSPTYNQRLIDAGVTSQRIYAIVKSTSEINPFDSVLLLFTSYKNGLERRRICYSYSDNLPDENEYPYSTREYHNVFDIPFDYKSLCYLSRYSYDTIGKLSIQNDSINWLRVNEYRRRSGKLNPEVTNIGNTQELISSVRRKIFNAYGRDSVILETDTYQRGFVEIFKLFEWPTDSLYKIKSLPLLQEYKSAQEIIDNAKTNKGELVEVGLRSKNQQLKHSEKYTTPLDPFNKRYTGYEKLPTTILKNYLLEPNKYVQIKRDVYFKSSGYYDSCILIFDNNDSLLSEMEYKADISNINETPKNIQVVKSTKYIRNRNGEISSIREDDYYFKSSSITKYNYKRKEGTLLGQEQISETFNEQGEIIETKTCLYSYDRYGNLLEQTYTTVSKDENKDKVKSVLRIICTYDSMGNKISEKEYVDDELNIEKEWNFNMKGFITQYLVSDKKKGLSHKIVWVYRFN